MEFTVSNAEFLKILRFCSKALETKATIPILLTFLLEVKGEWLYCTSTDLNIAIRSAVKCHGKEGDICLPGQKLIQIIDCLNPMEMSVVKINEKQAATIQCGKSKFKIPGHPKSTFPVVGETPDSQFDFDGKVLRKAIDRCLFVVRTIQESRFAGKFVLLECQEKEVACGTTDGNRMAMSVWTSEFPKFRECVSIPCAAAVSDVLSEDCNIGMALDDTHQWFFQGETVVVGRKITGQFPDWRRLLASSVKSEHSLTMKTDEFKRHVERAMICAASSKDVQSGVQLNFDVADLTLFGNDAAAGSESSEIIEIKYDGPKLQAYFSAPYLIEGLSAIGGQDVRMGFTNNKSAFDFQPVPEDGYRYITMPRLPPV